MEQSYKILIVDDEIHISDLLQTNLELEGYHTTCALSGKEALSLINNNVYDLVLLDVMLPDISGIELCDQIKKRFNRLPILMLSALGQSSDRIKGLRSGADDYLSKPFNLTELFLRMEKLLTRFPSDPSNNKLTQVEIGKAQIDFINSKLSTSSETHILTQKESALLKYMLSRKNEVIHRQEILNVVWRYDNTPTSRTIDNFISKLRKLIEDNPNEPRIIKTIRGKGYMILMH